MVSDSSDYSLFAAQHQNLLDQFTDLAEFQRVLFRELAMQAMASPLRDQIEARTGKKLPNFSEMVARACTLASTARVDDAPTLKAIRQYLKTVAATGGRMTKRKIGRVRTAKSPSEKAIEQAIALRRAALEWELRKIPPSIQKARAALAHEVQSDDDNPPDALCVFGVEEARSRFIENIRYRRQDLLSGEAMTTSARGYEAFWYTSYLRYYETFEPKAARAILLDQAHDIAEEMRGIAAVLVAGSDAAVYELPRFVDLMFAYARCRTVRHVLMPIARRALPAVLRLQKPNGAWSDFNLSEKQSGAPPLFDDARTTASAVLLLARYGSAEEREGAFNRAQDWLVTAQGEDGSWRAKSTRRPILPISTTTAVLEALKQTGIPEDHPTVSRGENFLLQNQQPPGLWWEQSGRWQTHLTSQVVEYFQSRLERPSTLNSYLKSARSLLLKSEQLVLSEDYTDGPLATAAAYHGLEHFLYGCLRHMDSDEPIYADNRGSTIGLNEALGAFERTLKKCGQLEMNAGLPHREQLRHLGAKRDTFIHRAESISVSEAAEFVATCRAFVQRFELPVLGFRLCE
jgi:hypothetical protein